MSVWKNILLVMAVASVSSLLTGCIYTSGAAFGATTGAFGLSKKPKKIEYYVFDVPPQVIYQIDDHRFFTMENYKDCEHGGIVYYHDTRKKIKRYITGTPDSYGTLGPNAMLYWKGDFIYAADDSVIASLSRHVPGSDRDTYHGFYLEYEKGHDHGRINIAGFNNPGIGQIIVITNEKVYIGDKDDGKGHAYPLPAVSLNTLNRSLDSGERIESDEWPRVSTPAGSIRFTCNNTIKPTSVKITSAQVFAADATGVPDYD